MVIRKLGEALLHIYSLPFESSIYLPKVARYEVDTPCVVSGVDDKPSFHEVNLENGFVNWINVAVVSDSCDGAVERTASHLVELFNKDCQEAGWLFSMMSGRKKE
jgi:hypothetical protein